MINKRKREDSAIEDLARTEKVLPMRTLLKYIAQEEIPKSEDLLSQEALEEHLNVLGDSSLALIVVGDIMLGGRASKVIAKHGADYPFKAVLPLLRRADVVLGNLEGPFARKASRESRRYAYAVNPKLALSLAQAGISVVTLANNHLLDCGRNGVLETLDALARANVAPLGAAANENAAHAPVIRQAGQMQIGLLGYYWNRRCAATATLPGDAMDSPETLRTDILRLRQQVDRVIVTFHWGIPYQREPLAEDRAKARYAIECGADAVVGHHPHILQPIEIYAGRPIVYSIGNFTFGSGNSRGEGMIAGFCFEKNQTRLMLYPLYVKNRDPRVNYQPKVLKGKSAERVLSSLVEMSELSGQYSHYLEIEQGRAVLRLPCPGAAHEKRGI